MILNGKTTRNPESCLIGFFFNCRPPRRCPDFSRQSARNCDYICESGATRNFEPWRSYNLETAEMNAEREVWTFPPIAWFDVLVS